MRVTLYGSARVSRHDVVKIAQNITRNHSQNCSLEPVQHTSTCSRAGRAVEDFCIDIQYFHTEVRVNVVHRVTRTCVQYYEGTKVFSKVHT